MTADAPAHWMKAYVVISYAMLRQSFEWPYAMRDTSRITKYKQRRTAPGIRLVAKTAIRGHDTKKKEKASLYRPLSIGFVLFNSVKPLFYKVGADDEVEAGMKPEAEGQRILPFWPIPEYVDRWRLEDHPAWKPCTFAKYMEIIIVRRFDPNMAERFRRKQLEKHPSWFR